jgi:hypothetical protein
MIKTTLIAAVAALSLASVAAPAFADTGSVNGHDVTIHDYSPDNLISRLHDKGINASRVEQWGPLVRAFVPREDGTQAMQLFTPDYLQPVTL